MMEGQGGYVFRRSRTLTGTTSAQVAPSAEKRGQLKTDRLKAHERHQRRQRLFKIAVGVGCLGAFVWYLGAMFIVTPTIATIKGVNAPAVATYQKSITDVLNATMFQHFGFLLKPEVLQAELKQKHAELRSVGVSRTWYGGNVVFDLTFRKPILVWQTGGERFYVDDQGVAFKYNHYAEPAVVVTDESGIAPESTGGAVASSRFISFLGQLVGAINQYDKGRVTAIIIPTSTREINLRLEGREYPIKTHIDRDPLEQAEDVASALAYLDSKGVQPAYLDVRVPHKAFYK